MFASFCLKGIKTCTFFPRVHNIFCLEKSLKQTCFSHCVLLVAEIGLFDLKIIQLTYTSMTYK